jgi:hypothetical protein
MQRLTYKGRYAKHFLQKPNVEKPATEVSKAVEALVGITEVAVKGNNIPVKEMSEVIEEEELNHAIDPDVEPSVKPDKEVVDSINVIDNNITPEDEEVTEEIEEQKSKEKKEKLRKAIQQAAKKVKKKPVKKINMKTVKKK